MKKEILVIGGTGTIGKTLVQLLGEKNTNYRVLARSETTQAQLKSQDIPCVKGALGEWDTKKERMTTLLIKIRKL